MPPEPNADEPLDVEPVPDRLAELQQQLYLTLTQRLNPAELQRLPEPRRRDEVQAVIERLLAPHDLTLTGDERREVIDDLLDEVLGLGPLDRLLRDPSVGDVLINSPTEVFVEKRGVLEEVPLRFRDDDHLLQIIERIAARVGRRVDETSPMVDARLPDGSRINAVIPPLALRGPCLSIRRFGRTPLKLDDLMKHMAFTPEMAMTMEAAVRGKLNIVVSGGTGSGKTTLLNTLSSFIPAGERVITIEDAAELQLQRRHVVQLETRPPNVEGKGAVTMRDLVRNALRMRPDRIIIGECRGPEALDMLQAMNSGHEGSLTTLHANSPRDALARLETLIMMAGLDWPLKAMRRQISSAVHLLIQVDRLQGGVRRVTAMSEITGMEGDIINAQELFVFQQRGVSSEGKAVGDFIATGVRPVFTNRLEAAGIRLPTKLFAERLLWRG